MDIYTYDGKALQYDGKCISPKVTGETWVLNNILNVDNYGIQMTTISFISNDVNFHSIYGVESGSLRVIEYDNTKVATSPAIGSAAPAWKDQAYRTITFLETPTDDLLTWLQANGTKQ